MKRASFLIGVAALALAAQAYAQAPDKLCEGLATAITAATDKPAFSSLANGWTTGEAVISRPAGMEGAHSCIVTKGASGRADRLLCSWAIAPAERPVVSLPERVKACAVVRDWRETPMAGEPEWLLAARLIKPGSTMEVVALRGPPARVVVESLTILAAR